MADERRRPARAEEEAILQQQFRRALSSFEGIILSQIDIKNRLGDRLNYSIQAGIIILGVISVSILVLLLTLSAQITRISGVVVDMNVHFASVSGQMQQIRGHIDAMERRVALLEEIDAMTEVMDHEMDVIGADMDVMRQTIEGIERHIGAVRNNVGSISVTMDRMNAEVQTMSVETHRVSRPARTMNKMFPFP